MGKFLYGKKRWEHWAKRQLTDAEHGAVAAAAGPFKDKNWRAQKRAGLKAIRLAGRKSP